MGLRASYKRIQALKGHRRGIIYAGCKIRCSKKVITKYLPLLAALKIGLEEKAGSLLLFPIY